MDSDFDSVIGELCEKSLESGMTTRGKNRRSDVIAYGILFDSKEELDVYEWIREAQELGFIDDFKYQPDSFELFEGLKNEKGKYIVRPHVYTADFWLSFTKRWIDFRKANKLKIFDKVDETHVYIDVKGFHSIYDDGRSFQINSKWVLSKFGIYIWKIVPHKLFEKTWLPKKCVLTRKTKKLSLKYAKFKVFEEHGFKITP